jgi:hypothetical protein
MMRRTLILCFAIATQTAPAQAEPQSYAMRLAGRQIGTLVYDGEGANASLRSTMDNTPLGVADGTFDAVTRQRGRGIAYQGRSQGNKTRDIAVTWQSGRVTDVTITPEKEATELSDPALVPAGTLSPTEVFGALAHATTCPGAMAMYDGRRVINMGTSSRSRQGDIETCEMFYRVTLGPGHLSPFRFKSFGMQTVYTRQRLSWLTLSAGGFDFDLIRQ